MSNETTSIFPKISMRAARVNANLSQEKAAEKLWSLHDGQTVRVIPASRPPWSRTN